MDPLSDVLSLLKPRNYLSAGFEAGGDWAVQFPDQQRGIKSGAVVAGRCWLAVEGVADAALLEQGDSFLLPSGRPFRLATDLALPPVEATAIFNERRTGNMIALNGGSDFSLVSSRFALDGDQALILLRMLPPIVHIRHEPGEDDLRWCCERMMMELRAPKPGGYLIAQYLSHMILVQALRRHLTDRPDNDVGWLFALADRQIGAAIQAMHREPAHRWTLQELGERAGMSRSIFALRFKEMVGETPMEYLTRWRMFVAADRLEYGVERVSALAPSLGYESESAFSTAFKRIMGHSPRQHGRRHPPLFTADPLKAAE